MKPPILDVAVNNKHYRLCLSLVRAESARKKSPVEEPKPAPLNLSVSWTNVKSMMHDFKIHDVNTDLSRILDVNVLR